MNWVDLIALALIAISALLAFVRGFVREALGIGAWIGAALFAIWAFPYLQPRFRGWIGEPQLADPATYAAAFLGALILLSIVTGMLGSLVRDSMLGGIDRTLGMVFGIVRGAALICAAYILLGWVVTPDHWPQPVQNARLLPYAYLGAEFMVSLLPPEDRPALSGPPLGPETSASALMHIMPQGRARP